MKGGRVTKRRKVTPENTITRQYGEINLSILSQLQATLQEDPLQDLTLFLESKLLLYQRSLKKITEPTVPQNVSSANSKPNPRLAKSAHTQSAVLTSETPEPVAPITIISSLQCKRTELRQVNVRPKFQSYVRQLPNALEWEELFAMIADGEVLWELFGCKVIKVSATIVVKVGREVDRFQDEVALMEFVKQSTSIPIPEVFGFHHNEDDECFIFMSYVEGCTLESSWPSLGLEDRKTIESQLAGYFAELRSLPSPNPVALGSLATRICRDARRMERQFQSISSERQFNEFLGKFTFRRDSEFARMLLSCLKDSHRIVLTHGDLQPRNILVQGDRVTGIVDWELGGWYPEYWEYVKGAVPVKGCEGWWQHLGCVTGNYPMEWAIDLHLDHLIVNSPITSH
jgi:aminoglycoside phosphotransferase